MNRSARRQIQSPTSSTRPSDPVRRKRLRFSRRGVASVLAMMFVVLFGSLAVAMAIVSKGNLRTAQTHLHVLRAMGAADTGMAIAAARLSEATKRFVMDRGVIDGDLGRRLWSGTWSNADGTLRVIPTAMGYSEARTPAGIAEALANAFGSDTNIVSIGGISDSPEVHAAPASADTSIYAADGWLTCPAVAVDGDASATGAHPAAFQVTFAPLANGTDVRIIVTGYSSVGTLGGTDFHYGGASETGRYRPLSRVIQQDFRVTKQHEHAVLSPSRIMVGKNVHITGDLGARYTDVFQNQGHPITLRSDFTNLNQSLTDRLTTFYDAVAANDRDGDNRLRVAHPTEGAAIPADGDFDGDGQADGAFADSTGDGYVDEFDLFINHYDRNGDGKVTLSTRLTEGTPAEGDTVEFDDDDDLAQLIDANNPDRNRNGLYGFLDSNRNGAWDDGEEILDHDTRNDTFPDRVLGWRDGVIDRRDAYTKMNGKIVLAATQSAWQTAQGDYHQYVKGGIAPDSGQAPLRFGASDDELPDITAASFTNAGTPLFAQANGAAFANQVAQQLGISVNDLATYTEASSDPTRPRYYRPDLNDAAVYAATGRHLYERMPFNAPVQAYADWYYRPRYENMVFHNVQIPEGNNGLFINCTFVGVTYVRTNSSNTHTNWSLYGKMEWNPSTNRPVESATPLDKSDFARYFTGNPIDGPANYNDFPDPPVINGSVRTGAARNTKLYSNNIRFHDTLFVGSIVSDTPTEYTQVRNKMQFTGASKFATQHPDRPEDPDLNPTAEALSEIVKTSMMLPNYSVDIGAFNSPTDTYVPANGETAPAAQDVRLSGTIVAGVLDVRGNSVIDGSLLLTFMPVAGQGPLQQNGTPVGNPAGFNCTLGYFGPEDGDGESLDPSTLPIVDGVRIVGWDTDNDGIADVPHDQTRPSGSAAVPFYGYGRIELKWNPNLPMPDGIMLPISVSSIPATYREGRH